MEDPPSTGGGAGPAPRAERLASLIVRSSQGDEAAFATVYDETAANGYGLALRVLGDPARAGEVVRTAYLELWAEAAFYDPARCSALSWVLSAVHRQAVSRVRSTGSSARSPSRCRALEQVSPTQGRAIELAYFDGHTAAEVARLSGVSERTARARIRDGLAEVRSHGVHGSAAPD